MGKMQKTSYKEPHFLFTEGALRNAAWAGWYAALGEEKLEIVLSAPVPTFTR